MVPAVATRSRQMAQVGTHSHQIPDGRRSTRRPSSLPSMGRCPTLVSTDTISTCRCEIGDANLSYGTRCIPLQSNDHLRFSATVRRFSGVLSGSIPLGRKVLSRCVVLRTRHFALTSVLMPLAICTSLAPLNTYRLRIDVLHHLQSTQHVAG